ncbi:MAG: hypothetical protein IJ711_05970 [Lachnospiraceae bacterium]|nr:hypothetical protein [Lachnospiraceae bacterium]
MLGLLKGECIKNRFWMCLLAGVLLPIVISWGLKVQVVDRSLNYTDMPEDTYTFSVLCNVYLALIFPCFVLLLNVFYSMVEERNHGWTLVLSSVKRTQEAIRAKFLVNILVCFFSYAAFTAICCYILRGRGAEVVLFSLVRPMIYSFLCFVPDLLCLQILCIVLPYTIAKVFAGLFFIMLTMMVAQSKYNRFYFPGYYFSVLQGQEQLLVKLGISIVLFVVLFVGGTTLVKKYVQTYAVS